MNTRISLGAAISLMLLVAALTFTITYDVVTNSFNERVNALRERENTQEKYAEIDREIRENYYGAIDETQLLDSIARGYLAGIADQYAVYYDAKSYERLLRSQESPPADIGAVLKVNPDGYLLIEEVYPDSPALSAELQQGDLIIKVDETDLTAENSAQVLSAITGDQGTTVLLSVRRGTTEFSVTLTRRIVIVPSVYSHVIEDSDVGYMLIKGFDNYTLDQFKRELRKLIGAGVGAVIFDVRDNPGGELSAVNRILDYLLPSGVIVSSLNKDGTESILAASDASEIELPMVVLQNSGTVGMAELFAQVLKDYEKAKSVGTLTAGKGVMQRLIRLSDGSAIELTVAKLLPPGGESFDMVGVKPDYDVAMDLDWKVVDESFDTQLRKALEVAVSMQKSAGQNAEQNGENPQSDPEQAD